MWPPEYLARNFCALFLIRSSFICYLYFVVKLPLLQISKELPVTRACSFRLAFKKPRALDRKFPVLLKRKSSRLTINCKKNVSARDSYKFLNKLSD